MILELKLSNVKTPLSFLHPFLLSLCLAKLCPMLPDSLVFPAFFVYLLIDVSFLSQLFMHYKVWKLSTLKTHAREEPKGHVVHVN